MLDAALTITLIMVGLLIGIPIGRYSQRQDDHARRQHDLRRNPDVRPRFCLTPAR